jgi:hypothetical protein
MLVITNNSGGKMSLPRMTTTIDSRAPDFVENRLAFGELLAEFGALMAKA